MVKVSKTKGKRRRRGIRTILEMLLIMGSFSLLAIFAVYCLKSWEKNKWEEAVSKTRAAEPEEEAQGYGMGDYGRDEKADAGSSHASGKSYEAGGEALLLERPVKRTREEVLERLEELKISLPKINAILENKENYPENMLEALANNPEMIDFVTGYEAGNRSKMSKAQGGLTKEEKEQEFPLFLQWDSRWGYVSYGDDSNIGLAGCGPTCLSMVLYYKTRNADRTPDVLARYAMREGYYVSGTGTAWAFMKDAAKHYGLRVKELSRSEEVLKGELDKGNLIICAMGPGSFTAAGHFIVLYGYDREGFFVNDPNSRLRSEKKWSYEEIYGQIKAIWAYS